MEAHIREIIAAGNTDKAEYLLNWCAWMFQNLMMPAEAAHVLRGAKGTGKGTLGNAFCKILGQHAIHISSIEHLTGKFNAHLRDAVFLFADEAFWPGHRKEEGTLNRLITEPDLFIEAKRKDGVTVRNMLHIMLASNAEWNVPAGPNERRYIIYDVSLLSG
jgi:hypothetical protein